MRAARILRTCCLIVVSAQAETNAPPFDEIGQLSPPALEAELVRIRNSRDGEHLLLQLETAAVLQAEARRNRGEPPHALGCLRQEEFALSSQLAIARAALDGQGFLVAVREYRRLTAALQTALDEARATGKWKKRFGHLGRWIRDWNKAKDPRARELQRRTLVDQAIRASLSAYMGPKIYGKATSGIAQRYYDEYVFNLMCAMDEENLQWLQIQLASVGWFDIRKFGAAADHAAWLLVQHADSEPGFQAQIVELLRPKIGSGDTNPENYAYLVDRVAVRAGRPQIFATQMECVEGEWLAPKIDNPESLDSRRAAMGLVPYLEQLARGKHLCRKQAQ
jgi:hypothetical protein